MSKYVTIRQMADALGISRQAVHLKYQQGHLKGFKKGRVIFLYKDGIDDVSDCKVATVDEVSKTFNVSTSIIYRMIKRKDIDVVGNYKTKFKNRYLLDMSSVIKTIHKWKMIKQRYWQFQDE